MNGVTVPGHLECLTSPAPLKEEYEITYLTNIDSKSGRTSLALKEGVQETLIFS